MSYQRRHRSPLGDIATTVSTAVDVVKDPYLNELICNVQQLKAINDRTPVAPCAKTLTTSMAGVGLRKVVPVVRGYVYAEQHRWVYAVAAVGLIGLPLLIGYKLGKGIAMSYGRDRDAHTRGAGAIAAADHGNARRAAARRAKIVRSNALDAHRSSLTYGPYGGLGKVSGSNIGIAAPVLRAPESIDVPVQGGRGTPPPPITQPPGGTGGGGRGGRFSPIGPARTKRVGLMVSADGSVSGGTGTPGTNVGPSGATVGGSTGLPPLPLPQPPSGPGVVTGGRPGLVSGTGVRTLVGPPPPIPPPTPPPVIVDTLDPIPEPIVVTAAPSSTKKYLLIAALIGGAYLVLRDKKGRP